MSSGDVLGRGFGHGKVILVGEHAVVHGHAALAAGISTGIAVPSRCSAMLLPPALPCPRGQAKARNFPVDVS